MIVSSFDRYSEVRHFDPATGALSAAEILPAGTPAATQGHYSRLDDTLVVLYRDGGEVFLRIGSTLIRVDDSTSVTCRHVEGRQMLEVTDSTTGDDVTRLEYTLPSPIVSPEDDPTPFAEPEDFDFGLFISNVANDPGRRSRIYREEASGTE